MSPEGEKEKNNRREIMKWKLRVVRAQREKLKERENYLSARAQTPGRNNESAHGGQGELCKRVLSLCLSLLGTLSALTTSLITPN